MHIHSFDVQKYKLSHTGRYDNLRQAATEVRFEVTRSRTTLVRQVMCFFVVVGSRTIRIDRTQVFDHVQNFPCDLSGRRWSCVFSSRAIDVLQVLGDHTLSWVIVGLSSYKFASVLNL